MIRLVMKLSACAFIIASSVACKDNANTVDATSEKEAAAASNEAVAYTVDTDLSSIAWVGSKPTEDHTGNISLQSGTVMVKGETVESGTFIIDMTSIEVTDLEGESAAKLKAHLEGTVPAVQTDFFNTPKYPTASFTVTGLSTKDDKTMLSGNLTLKDVTKNVTFPVNVSYDDNIMMLTSEQFTIDRTDWGIQYGSQKFSDKILDSAIGDDIKLTVNLVASK